MYYSLEFLICQLKLAIKHKKDFIIFNGVCNLNNTILRLLLQLGLIKNYLLIKDKYYIFLKCINGFSFLKNIGMISKPGKRLFFSVYKIQSLTNQNSCNIYILSTIKGIMSNKEALHLNIGGEVLFKIII